MQRELQAGLGCIEQKVLANLSSYLRLGVVCAAAWHWGTLGDVKCCHSPRKRRLISALLPGRGFLQLNMPAPLRRSGGRLVSRPGLVLRDAGQPVVLELGEA